MTRELVRIERLSYNSGMMELQYPPNIQLTTLQEEIPETTDFLRIAKRRCQAVHPDGNLSAEFNVNTVMRGKEDAVAILAWKAPKSDPSVFLLSCLRPAPQFRDFRACQLREDAHVGNFYEIPAGMVELEEPGLEGLRAAASRELYEEIGYAIPKERFQFLGSRIFSSPSISAERIFFLHVEIKDDDAHVTPPGDGSPMEEGAKIINPKLSNVIDCLHRGYLPDAKTEIGLLRLSRLLQQTP